MKEQLRYCENERCERHLIPSLFTKGKRCPSCDTRTEYLRPGDDLPPGEYVDQASGIKILHVPGHTTQTETTEDKDDGRPLTFASNCDVKGCPIAPPGIPVNMPWTLYDRCHFLAHKFPVEWIAYITGALKDDEYHLDESGLYFPLQKATGGTVILAETLEARENTIASIHSHVDFTAYFSQTDEDNFNHTIELVINRAGKMDCVTRTKLECGKFQRTKSKLIIPAPQELITCVHQLQDKLIIEQSKKGALTVIDNRRHFSEKTLGPAAFSTTSGNGANNSSDPNSKFAGGNPSDQAVDMALRILQRRIDHEPNSKFNTSS